MSEHLDPENIADTTDDTEGHRYFYVNPAEETDDTEGHVVRY